MQTMPSAQLVTAEVLGNRVRADSDAPVPWWSFAKTVLAAAALVLVAERRLRLDQRLPGKPFTLRQVLQHTAGLRCYGACGAYHAAVARGDRPWMPADMLRRVDADVLDFEPGHGWAYSNVGYFLVRTLIEDATGSALGPALQRLAFAPLGIAGVSVAQVPADLDATAWGNRQGYDPGWVYHGLLIGPPAAAALFLHRLLAGELLSADLLAEMRRAHPVGDALPGRPWQTANYGLGLMIGRGVPQGEYVGHTGGGPGSVSAVYQRAASGEERAPVTAAAFAPVDDPGAVERCAFERAAGG